MHELNFSDLLGADSRAARDRMVLLCAIGALGREVSDDILVERMARVAPAWTWEQVGHVAADLADGGALERLRHLELGREELVKLLRAQWMHAAAVAIGDAVDDVEVQP